MTVWISDQANRQRLLKWIIAFSVVSTALHFTHNFIEVDRYPQSDLVSNAAVQVGIVLSWPVLTAIGIVGYRLYARRRYVPAHLCLLAYSFLGVATLGHFLQGSPDIPPLWYATIFTDGLAGLSLIAFTVWSALLTVPAGSRIAT